MNEQEILHITCYALLLEHGGWDIQCGPLPFHDICAMHQASQPEAVLVEIASRHVARDISYEEDQAMLRDFIAQAKAAGWRFDAHKECWNAPHSQS
jgi:hypothetical protein